MGRYTQPLTDCAGVIRGLSNETSFHYQHQCQCCGLSLRDSRNHQGADVTGGQGAGLACSLLLCFSFFCLLRFPDLHFLVRLWLHAHKSAHEAFRVIHIIGLFRHDRLHRI